MANHTISCLMTTMPGRQGLAERAVYNWAMQSHTLKELIITGPDQKTLDRVQAKPRTLFNSGLRLKFLAAAKVPHHAQLQRCLDNASGDWICCWDDDNLFHPERLARQMDVAVAGRPTLIVDGMVHFLDSQELFFPQPEKKGRRLPDRAMIYSLLAHRLDMPKFRTGKNHEHPLYHMLYDYWKREGCKPVMIRDEWPWVLVKVRGDNLRGYLKHRDIATARKQSRDSFWLQGMRPVINDVLASYWWERNETVFVCGHDGQAYAYMPQHNVNPDRLDPVGEPQDSVQRISEDL
jgi:glycosyltransferase involved in cell wall biosynthesis